MRCSTLQIKTGTAKYPGGVQLPSFVCLFILQSYYDCNMKSTNIVNFIRVIGNNIKTRFCVQRVSNDGEPRQQLQWVTTANANSKGVPVIIIPLSFEIHFQRHQQRYTIIIPSLFPTRTTQVCLPIFVEVPLIQIVQKNVITDA